MVEEGTGALLDFETERPIADAGVAAQVWPRQWVKFVGIDKKSEPMGLDKRVNRWVWHSFISVFLQAIQAAFRPSKRGLFSMQK